MAFLLLLIGGVIVMSAIQNTQGSLVAELEQDVPGYFVWAGAIVGVGALGWVPGMRPISRALLALVLVVLVLNNYQAIFSGFTSAVTTAPAGATPPVTPSANFASATGSIAAPAGSSLADQAASGSSAVGSAVASLAPYAPAAFELGIANDLVPGAAVA